MRHTNLSFKNNMSQVPTSVSVVACGNRDSIKTCTISSLISIDVIEPTILFVLKQNSVTLEALQEVGSFSISLLNIAQKQVSIRHSVGEISDRLNDPELRISEIGIPYIVEARVTFFCNLLNVIQSSKSALVLGKVIDTLENSSQPPLVYFDRHYYSIEYELE